MTQKKPVLKKARENIRMSDRPAHRMRRPGFSAAHAGSGQEFHGGDEKMAMDWVAQCPAYRQQRHDHEQGNNLNGYGFMSGTDH